MWNTKYNTQSNALNEDEIVLASHIGASVMDTDLYLEIFFSFFPYTILLDSRFLSIYFSQFLCHPPLSWRPTPLPLCKNSRPTQDISLTKNCSWRLTKTEVTSWPYVLCNFVMVILIVVLGDY